MTLNLPLPADVLRYAALLARVSGFLVLAPVTGARVVPMRWRVLLCVAICVAMSSALPDHWRVPHDGSTIGLPYLAVLLGSELLLGIMASLFVHLLFEIFAFAGHVVGIDMSFEFAQQLDPTMEEQSSVMSVLMTQLLTVVFVSVGGIELLVQLAVFSVHNHPPGSATVGTIGMAPLIATAGETIAVGFQLALPIFCVSLLINVAMGLMTRFGEEFEVLMLAFPVRISVGFLVMLAVIPVWVHLAGRLTNQLFARLAHLLQA